MARGSTTMGRCSNWARSIIGAAASGSVSGSAATSQSGGPGMTRMGKRSRSSRARAISTSPERSASSATVVSISRTETTTSGRLAWKLRTMGGRISNMPLVTHPMVISARLPERSSRASASTPRDASSSRRRAGSRISPSGVGRVPWRERSSRRTPRPRSRAWICAVSGGCDMPRRAAARPKCPSSTTARKWPKRLIRFRSMIDRFFVS